MFKVRFCVRSIYNERLCGGCLNELRWELVSKISGLVLDCRSKSTKVGIFSHLSNMIIYISKKHSRCRPIVVVYYSYAFQKQWFPSLSENFILDSVYFVWNLPLVWFWIHKKRSIKTEFMARSYPHNLI